MQSTSLNIVVSIVYHNLNQLHNFLRSVPYTLNHIHLFIFIYFLPINLKDFDKFYSTNNIYHNKNTYINIIYCYYMYLNIIIIIKKI